MMSFLMENSRIPLAVYQFIDKRVVTLVLSAGFLELFGYEDRAQAYYDMSFTEGARLLMRSQIF